MGSATTPSPGPVSALRRETRAVVRLATPVVLVQLGMMLLGVVDSMMLGRVSGAALAAGALGNAITMGVGIFALGLLMSLDPLIAQAYGAGKHQEVARHFQRGLVLAAFLALPMSLLMWRTEGALLALRQGPGLAENASLYVHYLVPGNLAFLLFVVLRQTLQAMSLVWPAAAAMVVANLFNVVANYALVFGHFGFPALGIVGSAVATSASRWVMFLAVLGASLPQLRRYWPGWPWWALAPREHLAQLKLGLPIAVQLSLELWVFATVGILMGTQGEVKLAGHQIAINLASLSFMVPLGIGAAAATRVGNAIGRRDLEGARRSAWVCLALGGGVMTVFGLLFRLAPGTFGRLYTPDPQVLAIAAALIPIAGLFQVADGLQVVAAGALRGTADTRFPAAIALVGFWVVGLPLGVILAFRLGFGPSGLWWGLTAGLSTVAILLSLRARIRLAGPLERLTVGTPLRAEGNPKTAAGSGETASCGASDPACLGTEEGP